jgi:hypothetical protein
MWEQIIGTAVYILLFVGGLFTLFGREKSSKKGGTSFASSPLHNNRDGINTQRHTMETTAHGEQRNSLRSTSRYTMNINERTKPAPVPRANLKYEAI